jgi:hypothetical protein
MHGTLPHPFHFKPRIPLDAHFQDQDYPTTELIVTTTPTTTKDTPKHVFIAMRNTPENSANPVPRFFRYLI